MTLALQEPHTKDPTGPLGGVRTARTRHFDPAPENRKLLAASIRPIYTAANTEAAHTELDAFEQRPCSKKFPIVVATWRWAWSHVIPFFAFPQQTRRVIDTTNAIESISARLCKIINTRGHVQSADTARAAT